jgi:hypothetical protein
MLSDLDQKSFGRLSQELREMVIKPAEDFIAQLGALHEMHSNRRNAHLDWGYHKKKVDQFDEKKQAKDPNKLLNLVQKMNSKHEMYQQLNDRNKIQMKEVLKERRLQVFEDLTKKFVAGFANYSKQMSETMSNLHICINQIEPMHPTSVKQPFYPPLETVETSGVSRAEQPVTVAEEKIDVISLEQTVGKENLLEPVQITRGDLSFGSDISINLIRNASFDVAFQDVDIICLRNQLSNEMKEL